MPILLEIQLLNKNAKKLSARDIDSVNIKDILNAFLAAFVSPRPKYSEIYFIVAGPKLDDTTAEKRNAVDIARLTLPSVDGPKTLPIEILKMSFVNPRNTKAITVIAVFLINVFLRALFVVIAGAFFCF